MESRLFIKVNRIFGYVTPMVFDGSEVIRATESQLIKMGLLDTEIDSGLGYSKTGRNYSNGLFIITKNILGFFVIRVGRVPDVDVMHSFSYKTPNSKEVLRYASSLNKGFEKDYYDVFEQACSFHDDMYLINRENKPLSEIVDDVQSCGVEDTVQPYNIYVDDVKNTVTFATLPEKSYISLSGEDFTKDRGGYDIFCIKLIYQILYPMLESMNNCGYSVDINDVKSNMDLDHICYKTDSTNPIVQLSCVGMASKFFETINEESRKNVIKI